MALVYEFSHAIAASFRRGRLSIATLGAFLFLHLFAPVTALANTNEDKIADQLTEITELSKSDPVAAIEMIDSILPEITGQESPELLVSLATTRMWAHQRGGDNLTAEKVADETISSGLAEKAPAPIAAEFEASAGWIKAVSGDSGEAFEHYQKAHGHWSALGDDNNLARLYSYLAYLYKQAGDNERAWRYYASAWELLENTPASYSHALVLTNWGYSLIESDRPEEALQILNKAVVIADEMNNERITAFVYENKAAAEIRVGDIEAAEESITVAEKIAERLQLADVMSSLSAAKALLALDRGDFYKAAEHAEHQLKSDIDRGDISELRNAHELMAQVREAQGRSRDALHHLREYVRYGEQINSEQARNRGAIADGELNLVKREQEIAELRLAQKTSEERLARGRLIALAMMALAVVVGAALIIVLFLYRAQRRAKTLADKRAKQLAVSEEKANAANRSKSEFLASISHEIRTPLNGVLGMAQALAMDDLPRPQQEKVDIILDSGKTLTALLNDVLDLSKIEAGKLEISPIDGDLRDSLSRIHNLWRARADEKGIDLTLTIDDSVSPRLRFDPVRVRQCISNLISNAVKFTQDGAVNVHVEAAGVSPGEQILSISVTDTGIGMSKDTIGRLFTPFSQADSSTTRDFGGTGLGLSIARKLARLMDGDLTVTSQTGAGSTFTLRFKAEISEEKEAAEKAADAAHNSAIPESLTGLRILVVDDNAVNRQICRLMLGLADPVVTEAENGLKALEALEQDVFDIVLLDVHMPVMDGLETVRRIRTSEKTWKNIPVIALTADAMSGDRERFLRMGMTGYVSKPVNQRDLTAEIFSAMNSARTDEPVSHHFPADKQSA